MSPKQCRAARAWLKWSRLRLADKAGVSFSTVRDFEAGRRVPTADNLKAIRRALEDAGIRFYRRGGIDRLHGPTITRVTVTATAHRSTALSK
jgi:transcriptional regulator with XRE-family HTH domain